MEGSAFLKYVVEVFPYKIHTVLTDNDMAFADLPKNRDGPSRRYLGPHIFDRVCVANKIEHRLTKPYHPSTKGQAERMNRTIKDATVRSSTMTTWKASRLMSWPSSPLSTSPST